MRPTAAAALALLLAPALPAAELRLQPAAVTLTGPHATQRLLAIEVESDHVVADRSGKAAFAVADPKVARVDADGTVRPVADGQTTVRATLDGKTATAAVKVVRAKESAERGFRNHVLPVLTRLGCNSGA